MSGEEWPPVSFLLVPLFRNLGSSSWTVDAEDILVLLLNRRPSQPLRRPDKQLPAVLGDIIFDCLLKGELWTIIGAEVAEAASSVEVLWEPSVASLHYCDAFFWAYPGAYSAAGAPVKVQQVSSAEACLHGGSLLWKF